ncbi:Breast carcinoma-amplified sequence 3 like protein [Habropoda laboriosa]|uniref:Breast carcinoma-amplified sequence 3 like protein n=1 Tax=Habropoda laboriosa TaxID=597456 RepID=A0A0L7RH19_9HYME|nr:Breast carcinoma-amplified sequence 3 like protein [Habropoda laboriosa]
MSADSPRRGVHKGVQVVSPQPIVDRSIIDSVAGIINDIVPQAYAGTSNSENKESISWARFEYADINDPALYPDYNEGSNTPPLLLVLGYTTGVQVWLIAATGEATEVLSWRQGVVRTLRILPNPKTDESTDLFELKRPMVAICDSAGPGPQFCNISFISLKTGEQAKSIKFKNPVCDILANKRSIIVTFLEKIAVFDARTLEDVLTVTTCYVSPGPNPNPVALGTRWLAYSEKKLLPLKRSSGGCESEGVQSYTATVLYAAKSLGKGLRGLGETVASSLTGNSVSPVAVNNMGSDATQPGVITILDLQAAKEEKDLDDANIETVIAHFTAHSDAIVAMTFDLSGALLMTADKRGHDFHVFRIQPHPGGPTLAAVHHLYILHRGDTTAKVQDMVFSSDTRWAAISTVRGTTHVFPVAPYGGPVGVRTHSTPHVVNRLSRFHRSAGLMDDGTRSHSPVSHTELPLLVYPYSNPRLPPYPHPTVLHPLAQIRQPSTLNHVNSQVQQSSPQQRQRLHSDDSGTLPLKICACFAPPRAWMYAQRESTAKVMKRAVDSLFIMACHGNMIQYDLEPKPVAGVPKEKVCDDTMIELEVEAKGQWPLLRSPNSFEIVPPLPTSTSLLSVNTIPKDIHDSDLAEDHWLSQVEIVTHAGPHRRLWMGPQFVFKTYNATSGAPVNLVEAEAVEIGVTGGSRPARSNPVNMPHATSRSLVPVVIDGSGSSYEQSPRFMEAYGDSLDSENTGIGGGENQLREDLAEAMLETSIAPHCAPGRRSVFERVGQPVTKVVNPLGTVITVSADEEDINSSQEFDFAEESHVPEPPRSVCAEEGPASLGDFEPESQSLRNLTEICAEMRSASEPAIDSVPDENICEVKERKALCVEIAPITNPGNSTIDFEKEEAFRDVPTSLSLCVEQGEIPSSPMTQAKEAVWCKKLDKKEDKRAHERSMSEAQYVVNCDEDSVVLMENKLAHGRRTTSTHCKTESKKTSESEKTTKKSGRNGSSANSGKRVEAKTPAKKYILKEHEDSIVIEDTTTSDDSKNGSSKKKDCQKSGIESGENKSGETSKETATGKSKGKSKSSTVQDCKEAKVELLAECKKVVEPLVELDAITEEADKTEDFKSMVTIDVSIKETDKYKSPPSDSTDDFSSSEYHIVDSAFCSKDGTSVQSDEDIEHIQSSEITQLQQADGTDSDKCADVISCAGSSPIMQRKNSKNTISDDDLEYIHSSELVETPDKTYKEYLKLESDKGSDSESVAARNKRTFSDDLEHVEHSDVCNAPCEEAREAQERSTRKSQEISTEQASKSKSAKKTKDIVVIESDTSAADVTVIIKPAESWKNKNTEKKEESEEGVSAKDIPVTENPSPLKKAKIRPVKTSPSNVAPKRSQAGIEIIDIDAMQKAEIEVLADTTTAPECKILSGPELCGTRTKKSRKNKKSNVESNVQVFEASVEPVKHVEETVKEPSPQEAVAEVSQVVDKLEEAVTEVDTEPLVQTSEVSWSSVVKKRNSFSSEQDTKKEREVDPIAEVSSTEERRVCRRNVESSIRSSAVIDQLKEVVTETSVEEPSIQTTVISWSSIVKKKTASFSESSTRMESIEEAPRRKLDLLTDSLEAATGFKVMSSASKESEQLIVESMDDCVLLKLSTTSSEQSPSEKTFEKSLKLKASSEIDVKASNDSKNCNVETTIVTQTFTKEDFSEPERDAKPEKRSDSEQEVVPEGSSSSDELNANVVFSSIEGDPSGRETAEKSAMNTSTTSAYATPKKGNRSKKKKRR